MNEYIWTTFYVKVEVAKGCVWEGDVRRGGAYLTPDQRDIYVVYHRLWRTQVAYRGGRDASERRSVGRVLMRDSTVRR